MLAVVFSCVLSFILSQPLMASEVGKVEDTSRMLRREEAKKYSYFSFGFTGLSNLGVAASAQSLAFGYLWETTPYASIKATLDSGFRLGDDSASFTTATLGANFFFSPNNYAPFIGFDFGGGVATSTKSDIETVSGWAGGISAGVVLFRVSSVQLVVQGRYSVILRENSKGMPKNATASLGIAF